MAGRGAVWDQARRAAISGAGFAVSGACVFQRAKRRRRTPAGKVSEWDGGPTEGLGRMHEETRREKRRSLAVSEECEEQC